MNRLLVAFLLVFAATLVASDSASAQNRPYYGFMPFGYYQPYGAMYSNSIRTPPYFSTNPPVYYGARHSRPYGISPFASPPLVYADERYKSRLRTQFSQPQVPTPEYVPRQLDEPSCNPCVSHSTTIESANASPQGPVRFNPYVSGADDRLVRVNSFVASDQERQ